MVKILYFRFRIVFGTLCQLCFYQVCHCLIFLKGYFDCALVSDSQRLSWGSYGDRHMTRRPARTGDGRNRSPPLPEDGGDLGAVCRHDHDLGELWNLDLLMHLDFDLGRANHRGSLF